jgi:hypothetical protein
MVEMSEIKYARFRTNSASSSLAIVNRLGCMDSTSVLQPSVEFLLYLKTGKAESPVWKFDYLSNLTCY